MAIRQPILIMMVGVSGAGKSTYIKNEISKLYPGYNWVRISTDKYIEKFAAEKNKTYREVFHSQVNSATTNMKLELKKAIAAKSDIIWDQTNLTKKVRAKNLKNIPEDYLKIAVYLPVPDTEEYAKRLEDAGKSVPDHIIANMVNSVEIPSKDEGFDHIIIG